MCCSCFFCLVLVISALCLAQVWNSIQPDFSSRPAIGQGDWHRPGTTVAGRGFLVDNSQPGVLTFNDNPIAQNAPDTTGSNNLLSSNDPLSLHDVDAIAYTSNSPQAFNSDIQQQQQFGDSRFPSTTTSATDSFESGRVLDSSNLAQLAQTIQPDPQSDLALIGDDSPIPSVPFLDIFNNAIQGIPSMFDPGRAPQPIHDPEERMTDPEKPDCEDGTFPFCCNLGYPDGITMKGVPLEQRVHKRRLCNSCMCIFPRLIFSLLPDVGPVSSQDSV